MKGKKSEKSITAISYIGCEIRNVYHAVKNVVCTLSSSSCVYSTFVDVLFLVFSPDVCVCECLRCLDWCYFYLFFLFVVCSFRAATLTFFVAAALLGSIFTFFACASVPKVCRSSRHIQNDNTNDTPYQSESIERRKNTPSAATITNKQTNKQQRQKEKKRTKSKSFAIKINHKINNR